MGQKVNPIGFRTGIRLDWKSRWFAPKSNYGEFLVEDEKIRRFIEKALNEQPPFAGVRAPPATTGRSGGGLNGVLRAGSTDRATAGPGGP